MALISQAGSFIFCQDKTVDILPLPEISGYNKFLIRHSFALDPVTAPFPHQVDTVFPLCHYAFQFPLLRSLIQCCPIFFYISGNRNPFIFRNRFFQDSFALHQWLPLKLSSVFINTVKCDKGSREPGCFQINFKPVSQERPFLQGKKIRNPIFQHNNFSIQDALSRNIPIKIRQFRKFGSHPEIPLVPEIHTSSIHISQAPEAIHFQLIDPVRMIKRFILTGDQHRAGGPLFKQAHQAVPVL